MAAISSPLSLDEFPATDHAAWRAEAERALKGASFEKKLVSRTAEGIDLQPIYGPEDIADLPMRGEWPGLPTFLRGGDATGYAAEPWEIAQAIPYGAAQEFNAAARHDVSQGQTTVRLALDRAGRLGHDPDRARPGEVGFCGTSIATVEDLTRALEGLEDRPLQLEPGSSGLPLLALLAAALRRRGHDLDEVTGLLEQDPIGELLTDGSLPLPMEEALDQMMVVTRWAEFQMPLFDTIGIRAHAYNDAGGHAVQELAFALATGLEYLRQMTARELTVETTATRMRFAFSMGSDFFMNIAKLRAARMLWQKIVSASGGSEEAQRMKIHARTALGNKTVFDPYVNLLRNTSEACAAVLGGCDSLQVGAFDEVVRPPEEFSRRIARNTQIILREECRLDRVIDPAGGSWFVESLTHQLAEKAWELFQEVEKRGGMLAAVRSGFPQAEVARAGETMTKAVAQRRTKFVGTNAYANPTEQPQATGDWKMAELQQKRAAVISRYRTSGSQAKATTLLAKLSALLEADPDETVDRAIDAAEHSATLGEISQTLSWSDEEKEAEVTRLPLRRATAPFEQLRIAVAAHPDGRVFLANFGSLRQHKARADFATSFFQPGGFKVQSPAGFSTPEEAAAAALDSKAPVIVICSTDETYPDLVPTLARAIKAQDARRVIVVAGYSEEHLENFRAAGVDHFIHLRANCLETLSQIATQLGLYP